MQRPEDRQFPAEYRILVEGALGDRWSDYMGGLTISVERDAEPPVTTLSGTVTDQASLLGILNSLYNLGFSLMLVAQLPTPEEQHNPEA